MSVERDTDRQLRAWVSEGLDRAPERFVWAALDEIERLPQRPPWRTRLERLVIRARPAAAVLGVAAAIVVAVVTFRVALPDGGAGGPRGAIAVADLEGIVLWEDTMPGTWTLDNLVSNAEQVRAIPIRSLTDEQIDALVADKSRYLGGRYTDFSGPDSIFISWATAFERDVDAGVALGFYENEMAAPAGWGLGPGTPIGLGDGGFVFEGDTTRLVGPPGDPVPMRIYLWRHGNVLLATAGWFAFDRNVLLAVAEGMDARALASSRSE